MKLFYIFLITILIVCLPFIYTQDSNNSNNTSKEDNISNSNNNNNNSSNDGSSTIEKVVIPNLKYDSTLKVFTLWGSGIGNETFTSGKPELTWEYIKDKNYFTSKWQLDNSALPEYIVVEIFNKDYFLATDENHKPEFKSIRLDDKDILLIQGRFFTYNSSDISITSDNEKCIVKKATFGFVECQMNNPQLFQLNSAAQMIIGGNRGLTFRVDFIGSEPHFGNKDNNNNSSFSINYSLSNYIILILILQLIILLK